MVLKLTGDAQVTVPPAKGLATPVTVKVIGASALLNVAVLAKMDPSEEKLVIVTSGTGALSQA